MLESEETIMRKTIKLFLTTILVTLIFLCTATADADTLSVGMDADMINVLNGQMSADDLDVLQNIQDNVPRAKDSISAGCPVVEVYSEVIWPYSAKNVDSIVEEVKQKASYAKAREFIVFDEEPYRIGWAFERDGRAAFGYAVAANYSEHISRYVSDLASMKEREVLDGVECRIEGVWCFDAETSHFGTAVYLRTDKGVFVRYYSDSYSEASVYSEADFMKYGSEYYEYITSYDYNYDENGNGKGGGETFDSFVSKNEESTVAVEQNDDEKSLAPGEEKTAESFVSNKKESTLTVVSDRDSSSVTIAAVIAVAVLLFAVIVIFCFKKRKQKD